MPKPIVALVGRPNVGKSTLFNRLIGRRLAIVEDLAGTTRDRLYAETEWNGRPFLLVDTGGFEWDRDSRAPHPGDLGHTAGVDSGLFLSEVKAQARLAMEEADVIVFVVDGTTELNAGDELVADALRRTEKPVILAVNKADNPTVRENAIEFYALGLGDPYPISALHGYGTGNLLDAIVQWLPEQEEEEEEDDRLKIAIVGRPNVGKSSLLNKLLGYERVIVSSVPGTTRDAIDTAITFDGEEMVLIDTAGIRRRGKMEPGVEKHSFLRAIKAVRRADVCLLMIDATEPVTTQDAHIAGYILDEYKSVVVVVNKWDLIEKDTYTINQYTDLVRRELRFLNYVPVLFISARTGQRVQNVLTAARQVYLERLHRLPTGVLNRFLQEAVAKNPPKGSKRHALKFFYATQVGVAPPTFVFFVNDARLVHFTYRRYLENQLREVHPFTGTPLKFIFRSRTEGKK
ncbi:MAG: ribosome biogenesis GTPase Der [Caldilineae bacterium]|nr:MAG: ribosome biogenesis GTPase Der [Caldilineae bacterium]